MSGIDIIYDTIERSTGMSIEEIQETPLCVLRKKAEARLGRPLKITRGYAGKTSAEIDNALDEALR